MDQHPVPKNVLTVEFKLFGGLTVGQFMRILGGGIAGLAIYALNINPLISIPLIIVVVLTGVLSALVKDFSVRLNGIVRSLFVSPRYVWRKKESIPDALLDERKATTAANEAAKAAKASNKEYTDISLDRLLDARSAALLGDTPDERSTNNFDRVYGQEFEASSQAAAPARQPAMAGVRSTAGNLAGPPPTGREVRIGPNTKVVVQPVNNSAPRPAERTQAETRAIADDQATSLYEQEIQGLQDRLTELTRQGATPEQKQPVIDRINQLYAGIKQMATQNAPVPEAKKLDPKRMVYGVVVDKTGQAIGGAQVSVTDMANNQIGPLAVSGADGRFAVEAEFANGEYVVTLNHPKYQFLKYKIRVQADKLPAYRFREK